MRFYVKDEGDACRNMSVMSGHTGRQANMSLCIRFYDPDVSFVSEQALSINWLTLRKHITQVFFLFFLFFFLFFTRAATSSTEGCPSFAWESPTLALKASSLPETRLSKALPFVRRKEWLATPTRSGDLPPMEPSQQRWGVRGLLIRKWKEKESKQFMCKTHIHS